MRIIAGLYRGRKLITPDDNRVRPTSDRVRQAIFTALNARHYVVDQIVCDAFCGTGALGFEALSQGAKQCIFIDEDQHALNLAKENAKLLGCEAQCIFIYGDALNEIKKIKQNVDLWLLDPPYKKGLIKNVINILPKSNGVIMAEMEKELSFDSQDHDVFFDRVYASTRVMMLRQRPNIKID